MKAHVEYQFQSATAVQMAAKNDGKTVPVYIETADKSRRIGTVNMEFSGGEKATFTYDIDPGSVDAMEFGSLDMMSVKMTDDTMWEFSSVLMEYRQVQASVRSSGWSDLPLAGRDVVWDSTAADRRISTACGIRGTSPDWECYASAHLFRDDDANPQTKRAYKMLITDVIDGRRQIIPRAVFAAAGVLQGSRGGIDAPAEAIEQMRSVLAGIYRRMAERFDDPDIRAPWENDNQ